MIDDKEHTVTRKNEIEYADDRWQVGSEIHEEAFFDCKNVVPERQKVLSIALGVRNAESQNRRRWRL